MSKLSLGHDGPGCPACRAALAAAGFQGTGIGTARVRILPYSAVLHRRPHHRRLLFVAPLADAREDGGVVWLAARRCFKYLAVQPRRCASTAVVVFVVGWWIRTALPFESARLRRCGG